MDAGFDEWYASMHPRIVSALTIVAGSVDAAEEAVDESFARAYERWARVSLLASPAGWTYATALNVLRRSARRAAIERRLLRRPASDSAPPPDWSVETWEVLQRLPARERTAVALFYVADLTTDEIATAMRIASGTVGSTLSAARRNLARLMRDPLVEADDDGVVKERSDA